MDQNFIPRRITQLRLQRDISEYQLSLELGLSRGYVQAITSGRSLPSVKQLYNIVDYFDMTMPEFFDPENHDSPAACQAIQALRRLNDKDVERLLPVILRMAELSGQAENLSRGREAAAKGAGRGFL